MQRHTMTHFAFYTLVVALALGCACGDDDGPPRFDPTVEIGTGEIGMYREVVDGDTLYLVRGPQGGQHVWIGLRARNLDTTPALIRMIVVRERDDYVASIPFQVRLSFVDEVLPDADYTQISGLALMVPIPEDVLGEEVLIGARVQENVSGGPEASTEIHVRIAWPEGEDGGPPALGDAGGGVDGGSGSDDAGALDDASPAD